MAGLVLDASIAVAAILPDEDETEAAHAIVLQAEREGAAVPAIWPTEVANALTAAMRRRRHGLTEVRRALDRLSGLPLEIAAAVPAILWRAPLTLASRHRLTVYDATYVDLALAKGLPLASFDAALRRAAAEEGVPLLPV